MDDTLAPLFEDVVRSEAPRIQEDAAGVRSIFDHVRAHMDPQTHELTAQGIALPDDHLYGPHGAGLTFAPGAREAVISWQDDIPNDVAGAQDIVAAIKEFGDSGDAEDLRTLYVLLRRDQLITVIDDVMKGITQLPDEAIYRLLDLVELFFYRAPDRGPVKFALAVLGQSDAAHMMNDIKTIGHHEEFTLYAAAALEKMLETPEPHVFELAKQVHGWGRIELVHRLKEWNSPDWNQWLLHGGFRNTVLDEYLVYIAATKGNLLEVLRDKAYEPEFLDTACDMITALLRGGPAQSMMDYADGAAVVELYLEALTLHNMSINQFVSLFEIQDFLADVDVDWETRMAFGWTPNRSAVLQEKVQHLLNRAHMVQRVQDALTSSDNKTFETALIAADLLDLDVWQTVLNRVKAKPDVALRWYDLARRMIADQVDEVLELARAEMDLMALASGPDLETGIGSEFGAQDALMFVVQELGRFPNQGADLVQVALKSPVLPIRWTAARVLDMWGHVGWQPQCLDMLETALQVEPSDELREYMEHILDHHATK